MRIYLIVTVFVPSFKPGDIFHFISNLTLRRGGLGGGCLVTLTEEGIVFSLNTQTSMVMSADQREAEKIRDPRSESVS